MSMNACYGDMYEGGVSVLHSVLFLCFADESYILLEISKPLFVDKKISSDSNV